MKIAILTQPLKINYGGLLQAFALQKVLRDMGHDVETLKLEERTLTFFTSSRAFIGSCVYAIIGRDKWSKVPWPFNTRKSNFNAMVNKMLSFVDKNINISPALYSDEDIESYVKEKDFNVYVVGSDQVWRAKYNKDYDRFFLGFLKEKKKEKRIAYAASFGLSEWEYSPEQTAIIKKLVKKFDSISVREMSGVELCNKYLGVEATHVLDPTMLLQKEDYAKVIEEESNECKGRNYIFAYILDDSKFNTKILDTASSSLDLIYERFTADPILGIYTSKYKALEKAPKPVPQWLSSLANSQCVITDSFHGTVFSILYHKPFVVVLNKGRGITRIETLLKTFELTSRIISDKEDVKDRDWLLSSIDWNRVDEILTKKREESLMFLKTSLE